MKVSWTYHDSLLLHCSTASSEESDVNVDVHPGFSRLPTIKDSVSSLALHEGSPAHSQSSLHEHVAELRQTAPFESDENSDS